MSTSRIDYNNPHGLGQLGLPYHYEMLSDKTRIGPFQAAIERACPDKIVLESGTGSSVLSTLAARAGAKHVFAIELDPTIAAFARINIAASGLDDKITLIQKSTLDVTREDLRGQAAEVIIAENLSTWQVTEPEIQVMNHITTHLAAKDAVRLPTLVQNYVELAYTQYVFYETIVVRAHFFQFSGIQTPTLLSEPGLYSEFDMGKVNPTAYDHSLLLRARKPGVINSIRLTSPLVIYDDIRFRSSDSLMPPVVVPLASDLPVTKGETIRVYIKYQTNTSWEGFQAWAERTS